MPRQEIETVQVLVYTVAMSDLCQVHHEADRSR